MIVKDLSNSFNPYPKSGKKIEIKTDKNIVAKKTKKELQKSGKISKKELKTDFCIMPQSTLYSTKRTEKYCERHEAYFSKAYRQKSINDGLILFLTREDHRGTNGVHGKNGDKLNRKIKKLAQKAWCKYYNKTKEEFIKEYGKANN